MNSINFHMFSRKRKNGAGGRFPFPFLPITDMLYALNLTAREPEEELAKELRGDVLRNDL